MYYHEYSTTDIDEFDVMLDVEQTFVDEYYQYDTDDDEIDFLDY